VEESQGAESIREEPCSRASTLDEDQEKPIRKRGRTHPLLKFFRVHAERTRKVNEIKNERTGGVFCANSRFTWLMDSPDNIRNKKELEPLGSLGDLVCPKYILNPQKIIRVPGLDNSFCPSKKI
jgi:hypothetical protein